MVFNQTLKYQILIYIAFGFVVTCIVYCCLSVTFFFISVSVVRKNSTPPYQCPFDGYIVKDDGQPEEFGEKKEEF